MVPLCLDTGEPDAATSCKSGSEGGGWKSGREANSLAAYPTRRDVLPRPALAGRARRDLADVRRPLRARPGSAAAPVPRLDGLGDQVVLPAGGAAGAAARRRRL